MTKMSRSKKFSTTIKKVKKKTSSKKKTTNKKCAKTLNRKQNDKQKMFEILSAFENERDQISIQFKVENIKSILNVIDLRVLFSKEIFNDLKNDSKLL